MRRLFLVCVCVGLTTLIATTAVSAQPVPAGRKVGFAEYLKMGYNGLKTNLTAAAERMPDADYGFKIGPMPEVRTYGQIFAHVAESQSDICAAIKGAPRAHAQKLDETLKTKAEIVKALAASFAACDELFASLTDESAVEMVKRGEGEIARSALLVGLLAHDAEMYGISTVYLRAKGLVPPSTERQQQRRAAGH